jgi:outer membrane protein assembly factor BamB
VRRICLCILGAGLAIACAGPFAAAGDWPTWRYDAARSAAAPQGIAPNPVLLWSRKLTPVRQAWPLEMNQRLDFDASYEPVVMGQLLFLGSPNTGSITAYDTGTGQERWRFYTEGPVRCAPACWNGKLYAGSDDGYLYCLRAESGELAWKFRAAPADRPDRRHLGNGHVVSFWPARGGPVIVDGTVYFAAGIWPIFGVFLQALDAETGKVKWTNPRLNYIAGVRAGQFGFYESGLSPQGYLVAIGDKLLVPNGRSLPAGVDRATGRLIYYVQGWLNGDSRVAAHGDYALVGKHGVLSLHSLREVWSDGKHESTCTQGYDAPATHWFFPLHYMPYKLADGCGAGSALAGGVAYSSSRGTFYAHDLARATRFDREETQGGKTLKLPWWRPPLVWQKTFFAAEKSEVLIKAGKRLYGHAGKKLIALENLPQGPQLAWHRDIQGTPASIVAADNKLFVATAEGGIYCFGAGVPREAFDSQPVALKHASDGASDRVQQIIQASGVKSGYCLVLGLTDGRLVEELVQQTNLLVLGVDADSRKIDMLRRRFDGAGWYGSRVELFVSPPLEFCFPPCLASLIVSEGIPPAAFERTDLRRLFSILRPYGGMLCLDLPAEAAAQFGARLTAARLAGGAVKRAGDWWLLVRAASLPGSAPWTHESADAAGTFCSRDDLVKAPLGFLWYGDVFGAPQEAGNVHHSGRKAVNGGRIYILFQQRANRAMLLAHDAYTGRFLWRKPIAATLACFAAMADGVYVLAGGKCIVYEAQSGQTLHTFIFDVAGTNCARDIRVEGNVILAACSDRSSWPGAKDYSDSTALVCLDRRSGAVLWTRKAKYRFNNAGLALGGGLLFAVDSGPVIQSQDKAELLALDARSGRKIWATTIDYGRSRILPWNRDDWVAYSAETGMVLGGRSPLASAWDARTGAPRWRNETADTAPMILRRTTFIGQNGSVFDILTGKTTGKHCAVRGMGCNSAIGGEHLLLARNSSASYTDIEHGTAYHLRNIRSGCINNLIAADGLLNAPNFACGCVCNYPITTSFAMIYMPEVAAWSGSTPLQMAPPLASSAGVFSPGCLSERPRKVPAPPAW